jgi:hypothetical protein
MDRGCGEDCREADWDARATLYAIANREFRMPSPATIERKSKVAVGDFVRMSRSTIWVPDSLNSPFLAIPRIPQARVFQKPLMGHF